MKNYLIYTLCFVLAVSVAYPVQCLFLLSHQQAAHTHGGHATHAHNAAAKCSLITCVGVYINSALPSFEELSSIPTIADASPAFVPQDVLFLVYIPPRMHA